MRTKLKDPELFSHIKTFITSYLPVVRKRSSHTVTAYRDALNLYFDFLSQSRGIMLQSVTTENFTQESILSFMDWLQEKRGNKASTINQRLSHIRGFCQYLKKNDILAFVDCELICDIAEVKEERAMHFLWLTIEEVKLVLEQPDPHKKTGIRDRFFLALLYESGCRIAEILQLRNKDFVLNKAGEPDIHIFGKGNKHRRTPLSADIVPYYIDYCYCYNSDIENAQDDFIFYTVRNGIKAPMSDDNVRRFMNDYEEKAKRHNPTFPHLHPHLWRRTRAMHLYLAGVPLPLIAEWLGHSDIETTRFYARATDEMKRKAQRKLGENGNSVFKNVVAFKYANDNEIIKKLSGLS